MRRSLIDWLEHAREAGKAGDDAEVELSLDAATAQVDSGWDWVQILNARAEGGLGRREDLAEAARRALAGGLEHHEVWAIRTAAQVRATVLGDQAGAREALEAGVRDCRAQKARVTEWVNLAKGFVVSLGDTKGAARCLDAGYEGAKARKDIDGLCSIATATAELLPGRKVRAIVYRAERLAQRDVGLACTVASTWKALGETERAARVLDQATEVATTCEEALRVASAWSSLELEKKVARALRKARRVAETAEDWLRVAETGSEIRQGEAFVREALEKAAALGDQAERERVAAAYLHWLDDEAAADRVGPRGVRPEGLRVPARGIEGWEGSASGLFDWLRARVSREMLQAIAEADYGCGVQANLDVLMDIWTTGLVPRELGWHPREVLELTRWTSGEGVDHVERAFACTLICLGGDMDGLASTAAILVESSLALGPEARELAARFFAWHCETAENAEALDDGIEPMPLVALIVLTAAGDPGDPRIAPLVRTLEENPWCPLTSVTYSLLNTVRTELWLDLFDQLIVPALPLSPALGTLYDLVSPDPSRNRTA